MTEPSSPDKQFDTLPPAIVEALRESDGPAVLPDAERDADVFSGARRHLAQAHPVDRKRRNLRLFIGGAAGGAVAAAAMVGIVVLLGNPVAEDQAEIASYAEADMEEAMVLDNQDTPGLAAGPGDLDRSGGIDILDAYTLAQRVARRELDPSQDFNADGKVDQRDIDWLANRAVALNTGEQG